MYECNMFSMHQHIVQIRIGVEAADSVLEVSIGLLLHILVHMHTPIYIYPYIYIHMYKHLLSTHVHSHWKLEDRAAQGHCDQKTRVYGKDGERT